MSTDQQHDPAEFDRSMAPEFNTPAYPQQHAHERMGLLRSSQKKRVLLVDDDLDSAVMISLILRKQGHEVVTADNGPDGLGWGKLLWPEVVILDLNMPGMDGFETCKRMRGEDWGAGVKLVALTGLDGAADRERSKQAGFDLHLVKPIDAGTLDHVINDPIAFEVDNVLVP